MSLFLKLYTLTGFAIILSVCDNYLGKAGYLPIPSTVVSLLFLFSLLASAMLRDILSNPKLAVTGQIFKNNVAVWGPFFLITFFSLLGAIHPSAYWGDGSTWIFINSYNFVVLLLAMLVPIIPFIRANIRLISIVALALALWAITTDIMTPGTFAVEINRPSGFSGNSNWGALSVAILSAGALSFDSKKNIFLDLFLIAYTGWAIMGTLSRSGLVNFSILLTLYLYLTYFTSREGNRKGFIILAGIGAALFLLIFSALLEDDSDEIQVGSRSQRRLEGFLKGELVDDGSSRTRKEAALEALDLIDESPIFGHGTGFSRTLVEKPHNLFLNQGVNNGILGIAAYVLLLLGSFYHFYKYRYIRGMAFIPMIFAASFFSHNILEQRTFLILLGAMSTIAWLQPQRT